MCPLIENLTLNNLWSPRLENKLMKKSKKSCIEERQVLSSFVLSHNLLFSLMSVFRRFSDGFSDAFFYFFATSQGWDSTKHSEAPRTKQSLSPPSGIRLNLFLRSTYLLFSCSEAATLVPTCHTLTRQVCCVLAADVGRGFPLISLSLVRGCRDLTQLGMTGSTPVTHCRPKAKTPNCHG